MKKPEKHSNKLLWISLALFGLVYLFIIGYQWLFGGHFGDARLTISAYVGLAPWSSMLFCLTNIAISVLLVINIYTNPSFQKFLWRFMMMAFVVAFIGLSIAPRTPFASDVVPIHRFFSHSVFLIITLLALYATAKSKITLTRVIGMLVAIYGAFFIICYLLDAAFFNAGILWFESAFVYSFFVLIISSNHSIKK